MEVIPANSPPLPPIVPPTSVVLGISVKEDDAARTGGIKGDSAVAPASAVLLAGASSTEGSIGAASSLATVRVFDISCSTGATAGSTTVVGGADTGVVSISRLADRVGMLPLKLAGFELIEPRTAEYVMPLALVMAVLAMVILPAVLLTPTVGAVMLAFWAMLP